jgi:hypothetical protein
MLSVILGHVPKMILDDAFLRQSDVAVAIKQGLDDVMRTYGYAIDLALDTDVQPDDMVKAAMNEINAAQAMFAHTIDSLKLKECGRRSRHSGSSPDFPQVAIKKTGLPVTSNLYREFRKRRQWAWCGYMQTFGNGGISAFTPDYE